MNLLLGTIAVVSLGGAILLSIDKKRSAIALDDQPMFTLVMLAIVLVMVVALLFIG